jgi:quercetin 2,3-dioxygenase
VIREVRRIVNARLHRSPIGIVGRRALPRPDLDPPSPFSLLEEIGPTHAELGNEERESQDQHERVHVVTSLLDGEVEYAFSTGDRGLLQPGDVLWAQVGGGGTYSESMFAGSTGDRHRAHGLRFKVRIPARLAGSGFCCLRVPADRIPWIPVGGAVARARVLAGEAFGMRALVQPGVRVQALDWLLDTDADVTVALPDDLEAMIYVSSETAWVGEQGLSVRPGQLALLADGEAVRLRRAASTLQPTRLLLLAGPRAFDRRDPRGL